MNSKINKPKHIGVILDGNGRWALKRNLPRIAGHKEGVKAVERLIRCAYNEGIEVVSLFAFSTENWKRNQEEVNAIFDIIENSIDTYKEQLNNNEVRIKIMGDLSKLNNSLQKKLKELINLTRNNNKLIVNIGLNYGSKDEILRAVNNCNKKFPNKEITEQMFKQELYTSDLPDVDFLIRTSGEMRLSNFMIYQSAYAELYFPKIYWPDFNERFFKKALKIYSKRNRRFGNV